MTLPRLLLVGLEGLGADAARTVGSRLTGAASLSTARFAPLEGEKTPLSPTALWGVALTGVAPARNGVRGEMKVVPTVPPQASLTTGTDLRAWTFIESAARAGRRVAALNVPPTAGLPKTDGLILLPAGQNKRNFARQAQPSDLVMRLKSEGIADPDDLAVNTEREAETRTQGIGTDAYFATRADAWLKTALWVVREWEPDALILNLEGAGTLARTPDAFEAFVARLESFFDALRRADDREILCGLFSPYEAVPASTVIYPNRLLEAAGLLRWNANAPVATNDTPDATLSLRRATLPLLDYEASQAVFVEGTGGGVYVIRKEDDARSPALRRADLKAQLTALAERRDDTGDAPAAEPLFRVAEGSEFTGGDAVDGPDVYLVPNQNTFLSGQRSDTISRTLSIPGTSLRPDGWLLLFGPSLSPDAQIVSGRIADLAPTLLYAMGLPLPDDAEGTPLLPLFSSTYRDARPLVITGRAMRETASPAEKEAATGPDAETQIYERLKALGYVE